MIWADRGHGDRFGFAGDVDDLVADIRAGEVTELQIGQEMEFAGAMVGPLQHRADAIRVRWQVAGEDSWYTLVTNDDSAVGSSNARFYGGEYPALNKVAQALRGAGRHDDYTLTMNSFGWSWSSWIVGGGLVVAYVLIAGGQPFWATKWAWFWLLWLPWHVGYLLLLLFERPWSKRASLAPELLRPPEQRLTPEGDRRVKGGIAFVVVVAAQLIATGEVNILTTGG